MPEPLKRPFASADMSIARGKGCFRKVQPFIMDSRSRWPLARCETLAIRKFTKDTQRPRLHVEKAEFFVRESEIHRFRDSVTIIGNGRNRGKSAKCWNCNDCAECHIVTERAHND